MRIGILTLPLHTNYGGILQAYALQTVLKRMGHEVVVIDTYKKLHLPLWKWPLSIPKRLISKYLLGEDIRVLAEYRHNQDWNTINQHTQLFIKKHIRQRIIRNLSELKPAEFDSIVVGSDQVWRPRYFRNAYRSSMNNAFLAFTKNWNIKRIAYAASFGTEDWEYNEEETRKCSQLLSLFQAVSVREDTGVQLCNEHFGIQAKHVLDPTLLLSPQDYTQLLLPIHETSARDELFCYILDRHKEKQALIQRVSQKFHLGTRIIHADTHNTSVRPENKIQPPVETWLRDLYNARFVITDSFHACVFSILFEKPFIVIGNRERGMARIHSLLKIFGLQDRIVTPQSEIQQLAKDINWTMVRSILAEKKTLSTDFLEKNLAQ